MGTVRSSKCSNQWSVRSSGLLVGVLWIGIAIAQDPIEQSARHGSQAGDRLRAIQEQRPLPAFDEATRTLQLNNQREDSIPLGELHPGENANEQAALSALRDDDGSALANAAEQKRLRLEREHSAEGAAYRTMRSTAAIPLQDVVADESVRKIAERVVRRDTIQGLEDAFPECTTRKELRQEGFMPVTSFQQRACQRLAQPPQCVHVRNLDTAPTLGSYENVETISADVEYSISVADYVPGFVGGEVVADLAWTGTVGDVRITAQPTAENAYSLTLRIVYDTADCNPLQGVCPPQTANVRVNLAATIVAGGDVVSSPPDCLDADDGFCKAAWTCNESGPRVINGVLVDESMAPMMPRLYPGEPENQLCWQATAAYECRYPVGEVCGAGAGSGGQLCETVSAESVQASSCQALEQDSQCEKTRTACASNAVGAGEFCYVEVDTYQCRRLAQAPVTAESKEFTCDTPIRCMGSECISDDVRRSAAYSQDRLTGQERMALLQHALLDYDPDCTAAPCARFIGEALTCHRATGGTLSFCTTDESSGNKTRYLEWFDMHIRRAGAIQAEMDDEGPEHGTWSKLQEREGWSLSTLQGGTFTSAKETIRSDGASPRREPVENPSTLAEFEDALGQKPPLIWLPRLYGQYLRNVVLPESGWEGSAEEFDLAAKRGLRQCIHVGDYCQSSGGTACPSVVESYCCFTSALAKAAHEHLGTTFGDPRAPTCSRGTARSVQQLLSDASFTAKEWTAIQTLGYRQPSAGSAESMGDEDRLTGAGSGIRLSDQTRTKVSVRVDEQLSSLKGQDIHRAIEREVRADIPPAAAEPEGPGTVTFTPALYFGGSRSQVVLRVARAGKLGAVTASWRTQSPTGSSAIAPANGILQWGNGESGERRIVIDVDQGSVTGTPQDHFVILDSTTGGLALGVAPRARVVIQGR